MGKSESVCLVGGEEIPAHRRMYVFRIDGPTVMRTVPGRVCLDHGSGINHYTPARYYAMVADAVVAEYDRLVMGNRTPEYDTRHVVGFASNGADVAEVMGEALEVAEDMGYTPTDEDHYRAFNMALSEALTRLRVYYRAHYPVPQYRQLSQVLEAYHAWDAQKEALAARDNGADDELGETIPDEWHESNDVAVELLQQMAGLVAEGQVVSFDPVTACKHEHKVYDPGSGRVTCECGQYWPTFVMELG